MNPVEAWHTAPLTLLTVGTALNFAAMYLAFALAATWATERVLPALGVGRVVDARPRPVGQRRREIKLSMVSVAMFALWTPVFLSTENILADEREAGLVGVFDDAFHLGLHVHSARPLGVGVPLVDEIGAHAAKERRRCR